MAYIVESERVRIAPADGLSVEIERLAAPVVRQTAVRLVGAYFAAKDADTEAEALAQISDYFVAMARPTFEIIDYLGVVPPTAEGIARLPAAIGVGMILGWIESYGVPTTAADEMLPPGELRDAMNAGLRDARKRRMKAA